jgi:histidyl-tRNA synthetase
MSQGPLPGFRDFFPSDFAEREYVIRIWREVARRYAFVEYDGPPLEPLDLYTRKSGDEIVRQLYTFVDKGGREVALRPEMTPTFARMVASQANALRKPVRWFSVPQLFRYERQQRGRLREHFQLNVDIVGEADVTADAELLAVAIDIMRALGLTEHDVRARVSDRQLLNALLSHAHVPDVALPAVYAVVDKLERGSRSDAERRLGEAGLDASVTARVLDIAGHRDITSLRAAYGSVPHLAAHLDRFERYLTYLEALGVRAWVHVDLSIVRGLAYYTGIVFELFDAQGELRAICGGGRYDTLLGVLGGTDLPALGFGMGDVVLSELLRVRGRMPAATSGVDYWVVGDWEAGGVERVMRVASRLRAATHRVEYALRPQSVSRQLKAADAAGAREAVILQSSPSAPSGGDGAMHATIKTLSDGAERTVDLQAWLGTL